jgi:putative transposase
VSKDNITKLIHPGNVEDQLTEILRNGRALCWPKRSRPKYFLGKHADLKTEDRLQRVVRHGRLPEREVMTGIGPVAVRQSRAVADPISEGYLDRRLLNQRRACRHSCASEKKS